jgi:spore coat polysaccharide biosynthesis protein SpsF
MTSTRLPGKVLKLMGGKTVLDHHANRLAWSGLPLYVATTTNETDDVIAEWAEGRGLSVYRGSEDDVLSRYYGCARQNGLDVIVRVTSDCPLIDGNLVRQAVDEYIHDDNDQEYLSNCLVRTYPRGFDFEVFSFAALREAQEKAVTIPQREHVTPYIHQNVSGRVELSHFTRAQDDHGYRITLDTEDDFRLIRELIEAFGCAGKPAEEIITVLREHPYLHQINAHVEQKKS